MPGKRPARTESSATLVDFVRTALDALTESGRACFVVPAERAHEVASAAAVVTRRVQVGEVRTLLELQKHGTPGPAERCTEGSERTRRWYALATGRG